MPLPTIRPARSDEYDELARVWMNSWASTGLEEASNFLLAKLRARIPIEDGQAEPVVAKPVVLGPRHSAGACAVVISGGDSKHNEIYSLDGNGLKVTGQGVKVAFDGNFRPRAWKG